MNRIKTGWGKDKGGMKHNGRRIKSKDKGAIDEETRNGLKPILTFITAGAAGAVEKARWP